MLMFGFFGLFSPKKKEEKIVVEDLTSDSKLSLSNDFEKEKKEERVALKALRNEVNEVILKHSYNSNVWICKVCEAENANGSVVCSVCETSK